MTNITKDNFKAYVKVQESGVTNMFAVNMVAGLTGLSKDQIMDIMENYAEYSKKFGA